MKTKIGRRAKSALAILLTLCMVFSVFTVGIASVGAATADSESVGDNKTFTKNSYFYVKNQAVKGWNANLWIDSSNVQLKLVSGDTTYEMSLYDGTAGKANAVYRAKITTAGTYYGAKFHRYNGSDDWGNPTENWFKTTAGNYMGGTEVAGDSGADYTLSYYAPKVNTATLTITNADSGSGTSSDPYILTVGNTYTPSLYMETDDCGASGFLWQTSSTYSSSSATYHTATADSNNSKAYWTASPASITPSTANSSNTALTYYTWCYQSARGTAHSSTSKSATVYYKVVPAKVNLPKPTWSSSTVAANAGTAATLTVSNHSTISGQDSGVTYVLKKGSATLTSGEDYTFNNNTGVFTLNDTTTAAAGSYTVQAIAANTNTYSNSTDSDPATVTVYEPLYSLSGNVDKGSIKIGDTVITPTAPSGSASYWNTWQDQLVIGNPTVTPGVYTLTFTANEDAEREGNPDIGLMTRSNGQKAFILNGTPYNKSGNDLTITDAGIVDGDDLYVNNLDTPAGGSLVLKRGQTYTITIDQTKRYNNDSSYPYGKITITTTDVFADVAAKKQAFNATDGEYADVADAESSIGTASAQPVHNAGSLTTELTAVVANNNYEFVGWFKNAACTGTPDIDASDCTKDGNTYTKSVTITETTEYYALFKQIEPNEYTVKLSQPSAGTISLTGGVHNDGTDTKAYQGATVSLNATVTDNSKEFSHWVITSDASGADITGTFCANPMQATTTFTMPAQNVTVTAIYSNKTAVTITTSSNNTALGTADYTHRTYYVGDDIPITATNVGGVFSRWVVTGGTVVDANSATTTIKATGATVTARAVFDYKTYQLYYNGKYYPLIRQDNGTYVSSFKIPSNSSTFTVYNASDKKYAVSGTGETWNFNANTRYATIYNKTAVDDNAWASSVGIQYKNTSEGAAAYMVFYPPGSKVDDTTYGNGRISLVTDNPMGTIAQIYAKDGTIRYANGGSSSGGGASSGELWHEGGDITAKRGVTKVTKINSTTVTDPDSSKYPDTVANSDHLKIYSAPIGTTITIQTTVNATYVDQGYYVGMFVINGWKVAATDAGKGVYTATYNLSDEYAVNNLSGQKSFEITPVYYNKNFQYVTFYVDAESVPSEWKGTISTCADYKSTDGDSAISSHFEGSYPGQPLGREGDLYEIKVAKYFYDSYNSTTKKWSEHTNYYPSATITAYNYDSVHHYYYVYADDNVNTSNNKNYQTYDYADFSYLAQINNIEAILFRCMPESSKTNRDYCGVYATRPADSNVNTYKLLTDYYGNPIDALGNRLTKSGGGYYTAEDAASWTVSNAAIKIVSCGNICNEDPNKRSDNAQDVAYKDWRTKARWITAWKVFDASSTATHIAVGSPADFVNTNANTEGAQPKYTFSYASGKSASDLTNKVTFISYEKELANNGDLSGDSGNTGVRIDGQWYYSAMHDFDSSVQVHITTADGTALTSSDTSVDADSSAVDTNDGWEGTTSKTVATLDGKTTETYHNVTTEAALNCTPGSGYTFVGWYIYDGTNYTKIHDNFADHNTTMLMKKNYTIVAVVRKVVAGDLVITHSRYTGSKPDAHDGTGKYYVSAVVKHNDGTTTPYAEAQNSLTITGLQATDKLTITIHTVCNGADTFYAWYEEALGENYSRTGNYYEICDEKFDPLGETDVSYTFFEADCSTFFEGSTLKRNTIDLYSDIVHVSAYATLTYKYYDRFEENGKNQMVSYIVRNVPLDDDEITNGYIPSDDKISTYAPTVVDTIYTDTKWTIVGTKVERAASNVTLMATQTPKTCYVLHMEHPESYLLQSEDTETSVQDAIGAGWSSRFVPFNSWLIDKNASADNWDPSDFYVTAPQTYTYGQTTWTFDKFEVYAYDRFTGSVGDLIYSSNDDIFGYRIYADCVIYPVYSKNGKTTSLTAKVEPAVLNREVYGESTSFIDRLYADLLISYINIASVTGAELPEVIRDNKPADTGHTIETGVILDKKVELNDTDFATLKHAAENGGEDTTKSIISGYTGFTDVSVVKSFAQTATAAEGKSVKGSGESATLTKYVNKNADLTNKNRLDKVFTYTNSPAAQMRIFAAYSYVVIRNNNGDVIAYAVSDPQLFNFCFTGNKPLATVPA